MDKETKRQPESLESVVGVHEGVDEEVHDTEPSAAGVELTEAVEDVDEHGEVVIPGVFLITISICQPLTSEGISASVSLAQ